MTKLNRDAILKSRDLKRIEVEVPEWGGTLYIKELSTKEKVDLNDYILSLQAKGTEVSPLNAMRAMAKILVLTVVDEDDTKLFTDTDIEELLSKSTAVINRLTTTAMNLAGMSQETIEEVKDSLKNAR